MRRIIIICEGPTEKEFCINTLSPYFLQKGYHLQTPLIKASGGGIVNWELLRHQIDTHLREDKSAFVTTFIDYYGTYCKLNFPQWALAHAHPDLYERMDILETGMKQGISERLNYRFVPYMQLHEFEALLFNEINIFKTQIPPADLIDEVELGKVFAAYPNPELINNNKLTSPSHRLERIIKGYKKVVYGNVLAEVIGLQRIREKCPGFDRWIGSLERI